MNKEIKIKEDPWKEETPKRVLNSLWSLIRIDFIKIENLFGKNQNTGIKNITIKIDLNQFEGRLKLAEGSKTLNKLVIIFKLKW